MFIVEKVTITTIAIITLKINNPHKQLALSAETI